MREPEAYEGEVPRMDTADLELLIQRALRDYKPQVIYQGGEQRLLGWLLFVCGSLLCSVIIGGVVCYGKLSGLEATLIAQQNQINRIEDRLKPTYRGTDP